MLHSRPRRLAVLMSIAIGLTLTACSEEKDGAASTPSTSLSTTTSTTISATSTSTAPALVMGPDGLGLVKFGDAAEASLAKLREKLGAPGVIRESSCDPTVTREADWGSLVVYVDATSVVGYLYLLVEAGPDLRTDTGLGKGATVAGLRAAYGSKPQFSDSAIGGSVFEIKLPNGTLSGYSDGTSDADKVVSFLAGKDCGE